MKIVLGRTDWTDGTQGQSGNGKLVEFHPKYNEKEITYDFAVIKMDAPVIVNEEIYPICPPNNCFSDSEWDRSSYHRGMDGCKNGLVNGWATASGGKLSLAMRYAVVNVGGKCPLRGNLNSKAKHEFCTIIHSEDGTCSGDFGGPLTCLLPDGTYNLIGLTSWRTGCGPGDFVVFSRLPFIILSFYHFVLFFQSLSCKGMDFQCGELIAGSTNSFNKF